MQSFQSKPEGMLNSVQKLVRYKAWADEITFEAVSRLPETEINKLRQTNFKTILHTLNHVYVVDDIFKAHLQGKTHGYSARNTDIVPSVTDLWKKTTEMDNWYLDQADAWTEKDLAEPVKFEFVGGGDGIMTRQEIFLHLVNHGTYHRGFVSDMMYQVPATPPANDLTVFLKDVWCQD